MVPIEGSEEVIPADVVLIAAGFLGSEKYVTDAFHVALTPRTNVETKPEQYATSVDRVFTAGDMHRGQSLVVWAIHEGREAAKAVDESLMMLFIIYSKKVEKYQGQSSFCPNFL